MRRLLPAMLLFSAAASAGAQGAADAPTVEVQLSSFQFKPKELHLHAGQPVLLHIVNTGSGGHNFSAPEFFTAGRDVSGPVKAGTVMVAGHQSIDVRVTPAAGTFPLKCTHAFHSSFGMVGTIVVE